MNNKTLFKQAHKIARNTVNQVGDYQIAFKLALKELRNKPTKSQKFVAGLKCVPTVTFCLVIIFMGLCFGVFGLVSFKLSTFGLFASLSLAIIASTLLLSKEMIEMVKLDYELNLGF